MECVRGSFRFETTTWVRRPFLKIMLKHEVRLIDPSEDTIVATLTQTTAAANKRCRSRLLEDAPAKWRKFARAAAEAPEGYEMFRGGRGGVPATQVLAAWWTDAISRKHVVMRGRRIEHDEAKRVLQKSDLDTRPPLFHAYPEYVCRRTMNGTEQVVCACGCGAVGTPDSLSWMGPMCGPCFDRKEELGPDGLRANVPGVLHGAREPLRAVACSPDGTRVAAVEGDNSVTYWDILNRTRTTIKFGEPLVMDVGLTADGRYLLATGATLFAAFDLTTDPPTRIEPESEYAPSGLRIIPLPDPGLALFHRYALHDRGWAEVVRVPSGQPVRSVELATAARGRLSVTPGGTRFSCCGGGFAVYDLGTMTRTVEIRSSVRQVALSPDGQRLYCESGGQLTARDADTARPLYSVPTASQRQLSAKNDFVSALAVDHTGAFVFAGAYNGRLLVFTQDALRLRAVFDWHLGAVTGLAVSADGSRLFTAGSDGCVKVWPIRDLLRAG
ncbi:MAG TPA: hypothetical protein VGE74_09775 [Gemmata sp.]